MMQFGQFLPEGQGQSGTGKQEWLCRAWLQDVLPGELPSKWGA